MSTQLETGDFVALPGTIVRIPAIEAATHIAQICHGLRAGLLIPERVCFAQGLENVANEWLLARCDNGAAVKEIPLEGRELSLYEPYWLPIEASGDNPSFKPDDRVRLCDSQEVRAKYPSLRNNVGGEGQIMFIDKSTQEANVSWWVDMPEMKGANFAGVGMVQLMVPLGELRKPSLDFCECCESEGIDPPAEGDYVIGVCKDNPLNDPESEYEEFRGYICDYHFSELRWKHWRLAEPPVKTQEEG